MSEHEGLRWRRRYNPYVSRLDRIARKNLDDHKHIPQLQSDDGKTRKYRCTICGKVREHRYKK